MPTTNATIDNPRDEGFESFQLSTRSEYEPTELESRLETLLTVPYDHKASDPRVYAVETSILTEPAWLHFKPVGIADDSFGINQFLVWVRRDGPSRARPDNYATLGANSRLETHSWTALKYAGWCMYDGDVPSPWDDQDEIREKLVDVQSTESFPIAFRASLYGYDFIIEYTDPGTVTVHHDALGLGDGHRTRSVSFSLETRHKLIKKAASVLSTEVSHRLGNGEPHFTIPVEDVTVFPAEYE